MHVKSQSTWEKTSSGGLIVKVPLLLAGSSIKVAIVIEWSFTDGTRILSEASKSVINSKKVSYSVSIPILLESEDSSSGEQGLSETIILSLIFVGGIVVIFVSFLVYRFLSSKRKKQSSLYETPAGTETATEETNRL
mmetsp:Transcript_26568/g.30499  ORF Transcript_26568/g.30499 Transcript_26568/m.30499 type:complete len:137 (-) Transcript_26568:319-729(-)